MKSEAAVQSEIRADAPSQGVRLFRNNVGACTDDTGRTIRYGLGNDSPQLQKRLKSSDLVGRIKTGHARGIEIHIECKAEGWVMPGEYAKFYPHVRNVSDGRHPTDREAAQHAWLQLAVEDGCMAGFCTSVEEFRRLLQDNGA